MKRLVFALFLILVVTSFAYALNSPEYDELLRIGLDYYMRGDYSKAIEHFTDMTFAYPKSYEAYFWLGNSLYEQYKLVKDEMDVAERDGLLRRAEIAFRKALVQNPYFAPAKYKLGAVEEELEKLYPMLSSSNRVYTLAWGRTGLALRADLIAQAVATSAKGAYAQYAKGEYKEGFGAYFELDLYPNQPIEKIIDFQDDIATTYFAKAKQYLLDSDWIVIKIHVVHNLLPRKTLAIWRKVKDIRLYQNKEISGEEFARRMRFYVDGVLVTENGYKEEYEKVRKAK